MTLSLRHVEIFHAVMSAGGATQAAAILRTSQPTVSRELREFEHALGFALFTRRGRRLVPTEAALSLHAEVRRSFVGLDEIARTAEAIRANASVHLNVACLPAYGTALLPEICRTFLHDHRSIRLSIHSFEQSVVANGLTTHHYDVGVIEADPGLENLCAGTVHLGEQVCILPETHPLARKAVLSPADFEGVDFIYFSAEDSYRRKLDRIFESHGVTRRLCVEATTAASVCALVGQGLGVSIVNPISALRARDRGVALRRFSVSVPYIVGLYRTPNGAGPDLARSFLEHCGTALGNVEKQIAHLI